MVYPSGVILRGGR